MSADVKGNSLLMTDDEIHTIQTLKSYMQINLVYGEQARLWSGSTNIIQAYDAHLRI